MPGEYVVFLSGSGFQVVSADGTVRGKLGESFNDEDVALSPDAKFYAVGMGNKLVVLDLEQNTVKETSDKDICSYRIASPSWSPDSKLIAFVCDQSIGIASLQNETIIELVPRSPVFPAASWTMPLWSPDGHWIVYSQIVGQAGADNFNGPYVVDISCLSAPSTCESKTKQLSEEIEGVMAWTPDSRLAIAPSHKEIGSSSAIRVYDVETGQLLETIDVLEGSRVESMAWSPDGKWIAVSQFDPADYNFAIFLIPSAGGQPVRLTIGERVVSWLTVP
jgi:Tol biopolymer transport system component